MIDTVAHELAEDELDALVSFAIRRAQILDDLGSPSAVDAWHEVMLYEERLAMITSPSEISGGIARVGAVRAALAAGQRLDAERLASEYLAEASLVAERRAAIGQVLQEDLAGLAHRYPALARSGRLDELREWRVVAAASPRVFPVAA